jgi:methylglutaconyl-CoA hydratase
LLQAGLQAISITKDLIKKISSSPLDQHQKLTTQLIASVRVSTEGQEGLKSFLEKRKPNWNAN